MSEVTKKLPEFTPLDAGHKPFDNNVAVNPLNVLYVDRVPKNPEICSIRMVGGANIVVGETVAAVSEKLGVWLSKNR